MDTRKVQQLGPSTLAITLPAEWVKEHGVEKGEEMVVQYSGNGTLAVVAESRREGPEAVINAENLSGSAVERAVIAQYVLGRRVIRVTHADGALENTHINAVYNAESQLMGLGVVEETPEQIAIRCSVDADDFELDNLLERLESTGRTMRNEAVKVLAYGNPELARRALNREKQANKIFVLLLRLIFSAHQKPTIAQAVGLQDEFPLIGYRSIAKNLELTADNAQHIAEIALENTQHDDDPPAHAQHDDDPPAHAQHDDDPPAHAQHDDDPPAETDGVAETATAGVAGIDESVVVDIRDFADHVDDLMQKSVRAAVERDYDLAIEVRSLFGDLDEREGELLDSLSQMPTDDLLQMREIVVSLQQTAECAMRNAEIAANLAMREESEYTSIA